MADILIGDKRGRYARPGARPLWWSFVVIVAAFVLGNIVSIYEMRSSEAQVRLIARHAATNVELGARLSRDFDQKQILIEDHVLERQIVDMSRIEGELAAIDADIADALHAYVAIDNDESERSALEQINVEIAAMQPGIARIISLSRRNMNAEAQKHIAGVAPRFVAIDHAVDNLLNLNRARANHEVAQVRAIQLRAVVFLAILTVLGTAFALLTPRWMTHLVGAHETQMNRAMTLLEERNRELDAFAGRVAHDLRGPLTAINLAASTLTSSAERDERNTAVLRRGVVRMEAMIQDLLTLSRISSQVAGAVCHPENAAALAREDLAPLVEAAGGVLTVEAAPGMVTSSEGLIRQVLWNLGENAVKYRRTGVRLDVQIRGRVLSNAYELSVSDNGAGMTPSEVRQACEPFFRGKDAHSTPGVGLGLSIVKRVVEASGGSIAVDSIAGQGTTFRIHLPPAATKMAA
jgi:signal transduction histidine kinase